MPILTVLSGHLPIEISIGKNFSALELLSTHHFLIESNCGGRGTCGKCLIELTDGELYDNLGHVAKPKTGNRYLACQVFPREDCTIQIELALAAAKASTESERSLTPNNPAKRAGLAIDIGSTTVAAMLVDLTNNDILMVETETNPQRSHGADVISRIDYACRNDNGKSGTLVLQELIIQCINNLISKICANSPYSPSEIEAVNLGGKPL